MMGISPKLLEMMMKITSECTVPQLKTKMPESFDRTESVKFNWDNWFLLDTTDVWTNDGWLVVSALAPNTLGLRKGDKQIVAELPDDATLHFNTNPKIKHYGI